MWFSHILQEIANNHSFSFRAGMFLRTACVLSVWAITAISKRWGTPRIIFRLFLNDPPWNNAFFISLFTAVIQVSVLFSSANNSSSFLSAHETAMWFSHILQEIANNHFFFFSCRHVSARCMRPICMSDYCNQQAMRYATNNFSSIS